MTTYVFNGFELDTRNKLLKRNGAIISLNEKPVLLLCLLINSRDSIVSKSEILNSVWSDRVVSEQVIFQNISVLRSVFGDSAIKTYSKKGYQWQLPIQVLECDNNQNSQPKSTNIACYHNALHDENKADVVKTIKPLYLLCAISFGLISALVGWHIFTTFSADSQHPIQSVYEFRLGHGLEPVQDDNAVSAQAFFDSPSSTYRAISKHNEIFVASKVYQFEQQVIVHFTVKGMYRQWTDYTVADNLEQAFESISVAVATLNKQAYFSQSDANLAVAALELVADNDALKREKINLYFELSKWNKAFSMIETSLNETANDFDRALFLWLKSKVLFENKQFSDAKILLEQVYQTLMPMKIPSLSAKLNIELAWHHLVNSDFRLGVQSLNKAAAEARAAKEPLLELNAHRVLAFIASKAGNWDMAYSQLDFAKQIVRLNNLATEHWVPIFETEAWIEPDVGKRAEYYNQILLIPFANEYESAFYFAAEKLRDFHIEENQWEQAFQTIHQWQRESFRMLSKAHIEIARGHLSQGAELATQAFFQSQVSGHKWDALNSALLLLSLPTETELTISRATLGDYIQREATRRWRDQKANAVAGLLNG